MNENDLYDNGGPESPGEPMSDWLNTPTMRAAALEGVSENLAYPLDVRLAAAQQAIAMLHTHIEQLAPPAAAAALVQVKEYRVNAYPDLNSPNACSFQIRVIRFDDPDGMWGVFDCAGVDGRQRLGPDGQWSYPPEDDVQRQKWREDRRYTEKQALALAQAAAPHMTYGPDGHELGIAEMVAWEADAARRESKVPADQCPPPEEQN